MICFDEVLLIFWLVFFGIGGLEINGIFFMVLDEFGVDEGFVLELF